MTPEERKTLIDQTVDKLENESQDWDGLIVSKARVVLEAFADRLLEIPAPDIKTVGGAASAAFDRTASALRPKTG